MSVRPSASASVTSFQLFYVSRRWRRCRRCHFLCLAFYNPPLLPLLLLLLLRPSTFGHHKYHLGLSAMRVSGEGKGSRGTFVRRRRSRPLERASERGSESCDVVFVSSLNRWHPVHAEYMALRKKRAFDPSCRPKNKGCR